MRRFRNYAIVCVIALLVFPSTALNQTQDPPGPSTPPKKFYKHDRVIPNRYIVVLNDDVVSSDDPIEVRRAKVTAIADSHAKTYGGKYDYIYESALRGYAIELPNEAAAIAISNLPEVRFVEEDGLMTPDGAFPRSGNSVCRGKAIPVSELDVGGPRPAQPGQRTLFQGSILQRSRLVIRSREEFSKFWTQLLGTSSYRPPPPAVDFSREMIVVAAMGQQPSGGYQIVINGACEMDNRMEISVSSFSGKCGIQIAVVTAPVHIVRLPQSQLPVVFQETEVSDCKQGSRP